MMPDSFQVLLENAIASRLHLFDSRHETALRIFNGFTEGYPNIVLDVYGRTLVIHDHADHHHQDHEVIQEAIQVMTTNCNWLRAGLLKIHKGKTEKERKGQLLFGESPDERINEHGVWYVLDLTINRDTSFYLDTRLLRKWLIDNMREKSVLNTFAYTGTFGVAALAGKATSVVQVDRNRKFLELAKHSYAFNDLDFRKSDLIVKDFFPSVARFKNSKQLFDCVILDPPFFSTTANGKVDQIHESARLMNKVRPLINHGGVLVVVNNSLYLSGREYMQTLDELCEDGYLTIRELIPVPEDFIGYNRILSPITDPAPFNHSTKIAVLDVKRK